MRLLMLLGVLSLLAAPAFGDAVITPYLSANAISFDGNAHLPSDFELGAGAAMSLSPHISLVGSGYYGLAQTYLRGQAGFRVTATDVNDENFSIGVGMQYVTSTKPEIRPREWCPDVSMGWRPWPEYAPRLTFAAQGSYGLTSNNAFLLVGLRYALRPF